MASTATKNAVTCYLVFRLLFGTFDFFLDFAHAVSLFTQGHPVWGGLTLTFPLVAVMFALLSVQVRRNNTFFISNDL